MNSRTVLTENQIVALGKLISMRDLKNGKKEITLFVKRERDAYLKFIVYDNELLENIKIRDMVEVTGYVRAYSYRVGNKEWKTSQYAVLEIIKPAATLLQERFNRKGHFYPASYCKLHLIGTIVKVKNDEDEWLRLTIRTDEDRPGRKTSFIHVSLKKNPRLPQVCEGDIVATTCTICTTKKLIDGKNTYFTNYNVSDISVIKE